MAQHRPVIHYMATRPDGTVPPYYQGAVGETVPTVNLADHIGQDVDHPDPGQKWYTDKPFSYFLMHTKSGEVLENPSLSWPVRLWIVEPRGETGNWGGGYYPYWLMSHQLHVVGETDAWQAFGHRGRQVVATLAQLPDLTQQWSAQWAADPEGARRAHAQWKEEVTDNHALDWWAGFRARYSRRVAALATASKLADAAATESATATGASTEAVTEPGAVRALTLWQPWASAVARLGKDVENRTRRTNYKGLVLIHAGLRVDQEVLKHLSDGLPMPKGAVVAVARITGAHHECDGSCSQWADPGAWHWQLADVQELTEPVLATGAQGLWVPDTGLRRRVAAALPTSAPEAVAAVLRTPQGGGR